MSWAVGWGWRWREGAARQSGGNGNGGWVVADVVLRVRGYPEEAEKKGGGGRGSDDARIS